MRSTRMTLAVGLALAVVVGVTSSAPVSAIVEGGSQCPVGRGLEEKTERQSWERVKRLASGFWDKSGVRAVLEPVVSAGAKSQLGL